MKKFLVSIFAVFYLGVSCGFAFNIRFCMGKISSVNLFNSDNSKCGACGTKNMKGCCGSKLTVVKITDSQLISDVNVNPALPLPAINYNTYIFLRPVAITAHVLVNDTSPPPIPGAFLCILHSVFII